MIEVKDASGTTPITSATCNQWVSQLGSKHTLLRDNGQAQTNLALATYDIIVMDRYLKIVYRSNYFTANAKSEILAKLATLK